MKTIYLTLSILLLPIKLIAEDSITLSSAEYPPYFSQTLDNLGPVTEIITKAFDQMNYKVNIKFFPWARGEAFAKKGQKFQGMITPWYTERRKAAFLFSDPLFSNIIGFYKRKDDNIYFDSYSDLTPFVVGTVTGYANPPGFDEGPFRKSFAINDTKNLQMLCGHRVDLIIIDKISAEYILKNEFPECINNVEWVNPPLEYKPQHLVISKNVKDAQLKINAFNLGLKHLRKEGKIKEILIKHGLYDALLESKSIID